jgi:hypothetical protein
VLIVANQHRSMSQIIFPTIFAKVLSFASLLTPLSGLASAGPFPTLLDSCLESLTAKQALADMKSKAV